MQKLNLLYGSQTGTAEDVSERLGRDARRFGLPVGIILPMDEVPAEEWLSLGLIVFVCATTGQGEEPENMKKTWRYLLQRKLTASTLSGLEFAVFSLGDSKYEKFCYPGKKMYRRLIQLGATPVIERGDGDDQHPFGLDGNFEPWSRKLLTTLSKLDAPLIADDTLLPCPFSVAYCQDCTGAELTDTFSIKEAGASDRLGRVLQTVRLTALNHFQNVVHLTLRCDDAAKELKTPASVAVISPMNSHARVSAAIEKLGWTEFAFKPFVIKPESRASSITAKLGLKPGTRVTLAELLESRLDLFGKPKRVLFELAHFFAKDEQQRNKLKLFSRAEGTDELLGYCYRPKRNAFEVLCDFESVQFPIERILEALGAMRPRSFSIANAPSLEGDVDLTVGVVSYKTNLKEPRRGLCSNYLAGLQVGDSVHLQFISGLFRLPDDASAPIVCIATGTGIAPMRSLLQRRVQSSSAPNYLFQGCRYLKKDALYYKEFERWVESGQLTHYLACSRDDPSKKVYVQNLLNSNASLVWSLLSDQRAVFYVSGNSETLPVEIERCLKAIIEEKGGYGTAAAHTFFTDLQKSSRYQVECW